ncbi:amidohydrolase family protein [Sphingomonas panacisoli]|uniref:Amidohydrolase family protein n=1 Tax=Sphingomonas panacisoli TaxID=1813879 RepID=A0A5B8LE07_9SPHN|nr:amidohydrolase family protein [Sphingomonas panacisoli]QDZ06149.1 amidohydrolase family protein [Sphingomonas panacisoli]
MFNKTIAALTLALPLSLAGQPTSAQDIVDPAAGPSAIVRLSQAAGVASILQALRAQAPSRTIVFRDVSVVDPLRAQMVAHRTVLVRNGIIVSVGGNRQPLPKGAFVLDGRGQFLSPGLVDSHVHSSSPATHLLHLANGITSVREMDGFPWMLLWRAQTRNRRMLAPIPYVAGTIINGNSLDGYAVPARTPEDGRRIVREQAACGYEFIKIHNVLRPEVFDAIADEAKAVRVDLVGHVPHAISVRRAAEAGMRTVEHLKGWLNDGTLQLDDRDYAVAKDYRSMWVVPTLYATQPNLRGAAARAALSAPEAAYVPLADRERWRKAIEADTGGPRSQDGQLANMIVIVKALHAVGAQFLAGTDADGYKYTVAGFALLDELDLLVGAGLSPAEVLRAATVEPARAFRREGEFGLVKAGMRADLVLLPRNPLTDPDAYRHSRGVMANGYWLSQAALARSLRRVASLFAKPIAGTDVEGRQLVRDVERLSTSGYVFDAGTLENAANAFRAGDAETAERLLRLSQAESRCQPRP